MRKNIPQIFLAVSLIFYITTTFSYAQMGHGIMRHKGEENVVGNSEQESISDNYRSNGERIYYTGVSKKNGKILFKDGPPWLKMHGGGCVNCHGTKGTGGIPVMMNTAVPPDIRYKTLTDKEHKHKETDKEHNVYTDILIKRAITKGVNPEGYTLAPLMPRFSMKEEDINDLIEYLKTLQ